MNDLDVHLRFVFRAALFFLSACFFVWAFAPQFKVYAAGLVLGTVCSLINARLLSYNIHSITKRIIESEGKRGSSGFIARVSIALIAVMIGVKLPQFDLVSTIVGLCFAPIASFFAGLIASLRRGGDIQRKG